MTVSEKFRSFARIVTSYSAFAAGSVFAAAMAMSTSAHAETQQMLVGNWLTQSQSQISIEPCAEGLCGYISKVVVPPEIIAQYGAEQIDALGGNYFDANNQNPSLRDRPILGLKILVLSSRDANQNLVGEIYNPQDGKTYDGFVEVLSADRLRLNGCVLFGRVCQGEEWIRVDPLPVASIDDAN